MQAIANQLKKLRRGDVAIRRNPLYYPAAQRTLETLNKQLDQGKSMDDLAI